MDRERQTACGRVPTAAPQPSLAFAIESITECGQTRRGVTATIGDQQDTDAIGVEVHSSIDPGSDRVSQSTRLRIEPSPVPASAATGGSGGERSDVFRRSNADRQERSLRRRRY
ncbi:hypothetical protein ACOJIV_22665 [Haloarcula sp. AONF1]